MVKRIFILFYILTPLFAKEFFTQEKIKTYLNDKNPYYYSVKAHYYTTKQQEQITKARFDTKLRAVYEEKSYPLSTASYSQASLTKSLYNGIELSVGYRDAQGTQEYNNIKTGKDGEMIASLMLPLVSIATNRSRNAIAYELSRLQSKVSNAKTEGNVLALYLQMTQNYFELLYENELFVLTQTLLEKAKERLAFIQKEVKSGNRAAIELLDVQSQVINREQKLLEVTNKLAQSKNNFVKFLNLTLQEFDTKYKIPKLQMLSQRLQSKQEYMALAKKQRQEFLQIAYEKQKIKEQTKGIVLEQYPEIAVELFGVHDIAYEKDGYKVSANVVFPLERNSYKGKKQLYKKEMLGLNALEATLTNNIKTNITNLTNAIYLMQKQVKLADREIKLRQKLEMAENIKYREGLSSLVLLNQRESAALQSQKKHLQALVKTQIYYIQLMYEVGYHKI
ncbi:TolC family protein [Sulfurimonas sp.]